MVFLTRQFKVKEYILGSLIEINKFISANFYVKDLMKIKFLVLLLFLPLAAFAQSKKIFEITKDESQLIQEDFYAGGQDSLLVVLLYAPDFEGGLKIKSTKGWIRDKEPRYNKTTKNWELFFSFNTTNEIKINFPGFQQETLFIESSPISSRIISFNVFEKQKDPNANPILVINSNPSGALILIESLSQGKIILSEKETPFETKDLSADSVRISLEKEGFYKIDTKLELKKGEQYSLDLKLKPVVKLVDIKTKPFDAKLSLNGNPVLNPFFDELPLGTYNLTASKDYFHERTVAFNLNKEDSLKILTIDLNPKLSSLTLPNLPLLLGASVYIDDVKKPVVNGVINGVEFGPKTIRIEKNTLNPFSGALLVDKESLVIPADFFSKLSKNDLGQKTMKRVSVALGVGAVGAGFYLMQSANKNFAAYQKASSSSEAASLRKQVESADKIFPIAFGVGGVLIGIQFLF
jgi:hypothetical protein